MEHSNTFYKEKTIKNNLLHYLNNEVQEITRSPRGLVILRIMIINVCIYVHMYVFVIVKS